ncbi:unnamed protein product [Cuscuta campestris]|uniref:HSF-type DNA-binding domain-containing protein n=1 Tax=Cuscuta campestris TaxID=132261 RepID=A0A484KA52_9ASTE|nr:unnamed protein product [Cuscuta campestris]
MEEEIERLKRDKTLLVTEIVKLRQKQQSSSAQIAAMDERLRNTERKQHLAMSFLAKLLTNPSLIRQCLDKYAEKKDLRQLEIGQKRRLTMSPPGAENLQDMASIATQGDEVEADMESLFSAALMVNESNMSSMEPSSFASTSGGGGAATDAVSESFWGEMLLAEGGVSDQVLMIGNESEANAEIEDLVAETPEWGGGDLQDLLDDIGGV